MNTLQSIQMVRGASQLASALTNRRSLGEAVGAIAGTVYAAQTGGVGSLASGVVADVTTAVVDGVVDGVSGVVDTASQAGRTVMAYTSQGVQTLGRVVDLLV